MRRLLPVAAILVTTLWIAGGEQACAQAQNQSSQNSSQPVPDTPQPQKPTASKTPAAAGTGKSGSSGQPASSPSSTASDNPFPEDVSRQAAKQTDDPADSSAKPASNAPHSGADDNPFPEDLSRRAAKAAGGDASADSGGSQGRQPLPPGVSSSRSSGVLGDSGSVGNGPGKPLEVIDHARAKKDTQVGNFYLQQGNPQGAYLRYQDAARYDPTNVDAIFGTAEAARALKKFSEAERNYQLYLQITPNGPKAKRAEKALESLPESKVVQTH